MTSTRQFRAPPGEGSAATRRTAIGKTVWGRLYRERMRAGLERCRWCCTDGSIDNPLTFDHIVPIALGGGSNLGNLSILCQRCNEAKGCQVWALPSLLEEELDGPPLGRWSVLVYEDLKECRHQCPVCGVRLRTTGAGTVVRHRRLHKTTGCRGSKRRVEWGPVEAMIALALAQRTTGRARPALMPVVPAQRLARGFEPRPQDPRVPVSVDRTGLGAGHREAAVVTEADVAASLVRVRPVTNGCAAADRGADART